jgi:Skp family chaperone for outer membrane proteins
LAFGPDSLHPERLAGYQRQRRRRSQNLDAGIIERIATAKVQLARQAVLQGEWLALMDQALGVRDAAHLLNLNHLCEVFADKAGAARVMAELESFISRRQAELGNLESEIQNYAGQHSLDYLLPADMGGQAPAN